ncbi:hypothetical protein [Paenibacillus sp. S150]|uniref:hypothetical protein n=1 Tax=Paenibacillus sp. S150 TaxID=2749826 RepID=UPI001C5767AB|nr:hypothetical protein [Paenibacillus sp. S150]MBW4081293.1 hypothetical protein [Paenibacillus sp. S150]
MIVNFRFRECEHNGDLDSYARDVARSGGKIVYRELDAEHERGFLSVELENEAAAERFWEKFKLTDSWPFC